MPQGNAYQNPAIYQGGEEERIRARGSRSPSLASFRGMDEGYAVSKSITGSDAPFPGNEIADAMITRTRHQQAAQLEYLESGKQLLPGALEPILIRALGIPAVSAPWNPLDHGPLPCMQGQQAAGEQ